MRIRILIEQSDDRANDTYNDFDWRIDGDWETKGKAIEDMMTILRDRDKHNF